MKYQALRHTNDRKYRALPWLSTSSPALLSTPRYLTSVLCTSFRMLLSLWIVTSTFFWCLLVCLWKSHRILNWSFSTTFGGVSHFDLRASSPFSAQLFLYPMPATWSGRSMCALPASILQPAVMCRIVLGRLRTACIWGPVCCGRQLGTKLQLTNAGRAADNNHHLCEFVNW